MLGADGTCPLLPRKIQTTTLALNLMLVKSFLIPENLKSYVAENWVHEPDLLRQLREETAKMPQAGMQIGPDQGVLMGMLTRLVGAKRCVEVGVFTGYSSISVALALPEDGQIIACDVSEEFTSVARRYWKLAGVDHKIQLNLAPAVETQDRLLGHAPQQFALVGDRLIAEDGLGSFDMAFIDADKPNYAHYYERVLQLLKPNGLLLIDNVLWSGKVAEPEASDPDTNALRELNQMIHNDDRVEACLIPIGDGVTIVRKK